MGTQGFICLTHFGSIPHSNCSWFQVFVKRNIYRRLHGKYSQRFGDLERGKCGWHMSLFHVSWPNSVQLYSICILLMSRLIDHTREESKVKGEGSIRQVARKQLESRHSSRNRVVIYAEFDNSYYCGIYAVIWKITWISNSTCSQDYCLEKTLFFSRRLRNVEGIPFKQWTPEWLFFASHLFLIKRCLF